jgi:hypothetical protein
MVGTDPFEVDRLLMSGRLRCPVCAGRLAPWGYARSRSVREGDALAGHRPRRSCCSVCSRTHVLLPASMLVRRADGVAVIGAALLAKAAGAGHRRIAEMFGRPGSTVRGWLRRFSSRAESLRVLFTGLLHALDPGAAGMTPTGSVFADALDVLGLAAARGGPVVRAPAGLAVRLFGQCGSAARAGACRPTRADPGQRPRRADSLRAWPITT